MRRWLPSPALSFFLLILWLLLNQTTSLGHILLGTALAIYGPLATASLRPTPVKANRPLSALRLLGRVAEDIAKSNFAVAGVILGGKDRRERSGFMRIPLDMRDPNGLAVLSCIITGCPGTVWAGLTEDGTVLTIHVLDLKDEDDWVATVKERYESLLMEIFE